jgi:hypothetical protein
LKIYPSALEVGNLEGFSPDKDIFRRGGLAAGMTNLVGRVSDPLVIAFDGAWGSGKTTFLKMWAGELRQGGFPVIFFDAFENDYMEDAFAALVREVVQLSEESTASQTKMGREFKEKAVELGALLIRGAAKVGLKLGVRAATAGLASSDDIHGIMSDLGAEGEKITETFVDELLDQPRKQKETIAVFKKALEELPRLLSAQTEEEAANKPLIFIVDELDRCKPLFAMALLERIKHFMSVPNVHFVLGVHLQQLESSVRYAYGSEIDAAAYLQKFINVKIFNIEKLEKYQQNDFDIYADYLIKELDLPRDNRSPLEPSVDTIKRLVRRSGSSFRTMERAFTTLALSLAFTPQNRLRLGAIMGGLIMMKLLQPQLFLKAKRGTLTLQEAFEFLQFDNPTTEAGEMEWEQQWWTYLLAEEVPAELVDFGRSLRFDYNLGNRGEIVRYTANDVIDRLSP